jgi:N-acyl-D-aspartate/D-glutamate deacylase
VLDLVVADALIVDGRGTAPFRGSLGVRGDRIVSIRGAGSAPPDAARTIDGDGLVLAPGFIDVHNHSDLSAFVSPDMPSAIRQGVTTVVVGNCGTSPWPLAGWADANRMAGGDPALDAPAWHGFGDYLDATDAVHPAANIAALVGHGAVRQEVLGLERRPPSRGELRAMRRLVDEAMAAGAFGLSTGLIYVPGIHSETDEIVALAEAAARFGGLYASHIRGEGIHLFRAIDEATAIGRRAGVPVHVSHLKCETSLAWGRAAELLERLHRDDDVSADQYPYAAWNSTLASLLPPWAPVEDLAVVAVRDRERLRAAVEEGEPDFQSSVDGVGWDRIVITGTSDERRLGRSIDAIARSMGVDPFDACVQLLIDDPSTSCIGHAMDEGDVRAILADPDVFVASDGAAISPTGRAGHFPVHPREYGTFPRALALVRDEGLMPLSMAVRMMTSVAADRFGLRDRGRLTEGAFADVVLVDADRVRDTATYEAPHRFPEGIASVVVNGTVAWEAGRDSIEGAGRVLRHG